jgi:hypothetical protein
VLTLPYQLPHAVLYLWVMLHRLQAGELEPSHIVTQIAAQLLQRLWLCSSVVLRAMEARVDVL